jgi:colanic acid/amylovoran biosynthesis glycosyltransferase
MKIAIIISEFPSLNETFVLDHITSLIDRGHDVHIYATAPRGEPKIHEDVRRYNLLSRTVYRDSSKFSIPRARLVRALKGTPLFARGLLGNPRGAVNSLNVFRLGRAAASLTTLYEAAPFLTKSGKYDIIHCHFPNNGELAVSLRDLGIIQGKIVTSFHGYQIPHFATGAIWQLYGNLAKRGDLFLTCSEHMKRWFEGQGWGRRKTMVHRYAVRVGLFSASAPSPPDNTEVRLLSIGRLVEKKGFHFAIRGVAEVLQRFPHIQYEIAGDGNEKPSLERLIAELGAARNIRLLGWKDREEILRLYQQAHIFLAPSVVSQDGDQEGVPLVLHEAMACGLPVISTRHTGIPELVRDGESGFLVAEKDADAIAARLMDLLDHPRTWPEMGQRGRKHIEHHNSLEKQTDRLIEIYRLLLAGDLTKIAA